MAASRFGARIARLVVAAARFSRSHRFVICKPNNLARHRTQVNSPMRVVTQVATSPQNERPM